MTAAEKVLGFFVISSGLALTFSLWLATMSVCGQQTFVRIPVVEGCESYLISLTK